MNVLLFFKSHTLQSRFDDLVMCATCLTTTSFSRVCVMDVKYNIKALSDGLDRQSYYWKRNLIPFVIVGYYGKRCLLCIQYPPVEAA